MRITNVRKDRFDLDQIRRRAATASLAAAALI
jgi:hypothetical protein